MSEPSQIEKPERQIDSIYDQLDSLRDLANNVRERVESMANRTVGSVPEESETDKKGSLEATCHLDELQRRIGEIYRIVEDARNAVSRLENGI